MVDRIEYAFPIYTPDMSLGDTAGPGMTLRDWFAGQALAGIVGEHHAAGRIDWQRDAAWAAYSMADAMLSARQKGGA
jgi:hypothetical protein